MAEKDNPFGANRLLSRCVNAARDVARFRRQESRTSATPPNPLSGARFDRLLKELLKSHDGVFLGECHDQPAFMQSITHLLPMLKSNGVGTISIELGQATVDSVRLNQSYKEFSSQHGACLGKADFDLVHAAKQLGMKVLGHESEAAIAEAVTVAKKVEDLRMQKKPREAAAVEGAAVAKWSTTEAVSARDAFAEAYIRERKEGKAIVLGGKGHSGRYGPLDAAVASQEDIALKGGEYRGLDVLLGYPSIDFKNANARHEIGTTADGGRFSDYTVRLPVDLKKVGIDSWPLSRPEKTDKALFNPFEPFKNLKAFPESQPPLGIPGRGGSKARPPTL